MPPEEGIASPLRTWGITMRLATLTLLSSLALLAACSKSGGEVSSTRTTSGASFFGGTNEKLASGDVKAKLEKAGWTLRTDDADDADGWPSRYIKMEKAKGDDVLTATLWVDAFGEPMHGEPKPHVEVGKGALMRFGAERVAGKGAPDLAAFAKDVVAILPPEKATDGHLFTDPAFEKAVTKHGLSGAQSGSGGRSSPTGVVFNHRTPSVKGGGQVAIEIVHYARAVETGAARLFGTTLVSVDASPEVRKDVFAALAK